jgi:hypothetical protein
MLTAVDQFRSAELRPSLIGSIIVGAAGFHTDEPVGGIPVAIAKPALGSERLRIVSIHRDNVALRGRGRILDESGNLGPSILRNC